MHDFNLSKFWQATPTKYSFDETDNLFVSESENYDLDARFVKEHNLTALAVSFEGTTVYEFLIQGNPIEGRELMEACYATVAGAMHSALLGTWDAKDRDNYLRDLFTIVRQIERNAPDEEIQELLRRIKPVSDDVDYAPDGIYWNASHYIRKFFPEEDSLPPVQYSNGQMVFLLRPMYDEHQIEVLTMAFRDDLSLQGRKVIAWYMHYEEDLQQLITEFKESVDKLGWKLV